MPYFQHVQGVILTMRSDSSRELSDAIASDDRFKGFKARVEQCGLTLGTTASQDVDVLSVFVGKDTLSDSNAGKTVIGRLATAKEMQQARDFGAELAAIVASHAEATMREGIALSQWD